MKNYGYIRLAAAVNCTKVADIAHNLNSIESMINKAQQDGVSIISFPELALTGCSCGDLFGQSLLIEEAEKAVCSLIELSKGKSMSIVVGVPVQFRSRLYNCAAVICDGSIKGIVPKTYMANAQESRWFASGSDFMTSAAAEISYAGQKCSLSPKQLFSIGDASFAVEIGSDVKAPIPPSSYHTLAGAQIVVNIAAENDVYTSSSRLSTLLEQQSHRSICAYMHSSAWGESSQDTVYPGSASIWEVGKLIAEKERYSQAGYIIADIDFERINSLRMKSASYCNVSPDGSTSASYYEKYKQTEPGNLADTDFQSKFYRHVEPHPFAAAEGMDKRCREILAIQVEALCRRLNRIGSKAVIGISGGLDSTLALLVTALAFDSMKQSDERWKRENIIAVTMPGFGTTSRTKNNAWDLMEALGVTCREVSIVPACKQHFQDIGHDQAVHDATYENSQARERTQILMDIANQVGGIVIGTGDLSELALGWATYNGDHMSMYGVNAGVPKTLVRGLVQWAAENRFNDSSELAADGRSVKEILLDIVDTPISPELLPANENGEIQQVTEDLVGPYELHDFFIYNFMRYGYSPEKIFFLAQKAFGPEAEKSEGTGTYDDQTIKKWLKTFVRRFFSQQFKRSCMPDGPAVGSVSLSPRGGWCMPSDAWSTLFDGNL